MYFPHHRLMALPLLVILLSSLTFVRCTAGGQADTPPSGDSGSFHTAHISPIGSSSSPPTPDSAPPPSHPLPSRIVYEDEDPKQRAWPGCVQSWTKPPLPVECDISTNHYDILVPIFKPLRTEAEPSVSGAQEEQETEVPVDKVKEDLVDVPVDKVKEDLVDVPVERVRGDLTDEEEVERMARVRSKALIGSPPAGLVEGRRRFNERPLRRPMFEVPVAAGGGMRSTSPTRLALDTAAAKLAELQREQQLQLQRSDELQRGGTRRGSVPSTPADESSKYFSGAAAAHRDSPIRTPPAGFTSDYPNSRADTPPYRHSLPSTPPSPLNNDLGELRAPYRMWSARAALPSINIPASHITNPSQSDFSHYQRTLYALSKHDWFQQLPDRVIWAARARQDHVRSARIITPLGAVTGSDIPTQTPDFIASPNDPIPRLDSVEASDLHKKIHAWHRFASLLPPPLTAKSQAVWESHHAAGYGGVASEVHDAVHPVQYVSQMLRDHNAAVVVENSVHHELHRGLVVNPPDVSKLKGKGKGATLKGKGKGATLEEVLGSEYAAHNGFWPSFYHRKEPMKIKNPLDVELEEFPAFAPFADAVELRPV